MQVIANKITQNPAIVKFELDEIIVRTENFEFKNIDETQNSPLAKQLFFLPFVKTVYVSGNFIAIEKFSIVEWEDVQEDVANQINEFISNGGEIIKIDETKTKKQPITVYAETTPNPSVLKFVCNKLLTKTALECKNIDETSASPLAKELFKFPFVKEVFIDENYISVTKFAITEWDEITLELRTFIKEYIENGNIVIDETAIVKTEIHQKQQDILGLRIYPEYKKTSKLLPYHGVAVLKKVDEKYCMLIQPEINIASQIGCKRYINNYAFSDFYLDL